MKPMTLSTEHEGGEVRLYVCPSDIAVVQAVYVSIRNDAGFSTMLSFTPAEARELARTLVNAAAQMEHGPWYGDDVARAEEIAARDRGPV